MEDAVDVYLQLCPLICGSNRGLVGGLGNSNLDIKDVSGILFPIRRLLW